MIARLIAVYGLGRLLAILLSSVAAAIALGNPGHKGELATLIVWALVLAESASFAIVHRRDA